LFDAAHAQTAGNADWTLDEDSCGIAQRFPTPDQAGITSTTAETYWNGAHSAMGVDLVKKGFHVESLPVGAHITYGDGTNAQDLSHYNVFVMPEPNIALTSTEITAIRNFVQNGGGLFMISDHAGADRNNDGIDAAGVFNQLMGSPSIFGITYNDNASDSTFGWFDNHPDGNFTTITSSPIIWSGTYGIPSSSRGLGLFGSSSMTLSGAAKGHVWKTTSTHDTSTGVTYATSTYGSGRIAAIADSSVTEDATNSCGHGTFLGYNDPSYDNGLMVANGIAWLANGGGGGDTQAPAVSITAPLNGATVVGTVSVNATASDNVGVTKVEFYLDGALKSTDTTSPYSWSWYTTTASNGTHSLTAKAYDAALNAGTSIAVSVTVNNPTGTDISGWTVTQANATVVYTIPAGTV
ncbi:MAG: Ig-like domain-containing protein, partial [Thermoanaerobaculia bacterium]